MVGRVLKVGTRGSTLALWQAGWVRSLLDAKSEICVIRTSGDRLADVPLQGRSTMGFFTREIEAALVDGRVDLAVHSLKDLPVTQPDGLVLAAILERHEPSDVLLVRPEAHDPARALPVREGARCGAGSLRRSSALREIRPDLEPVLVRGNVPTRVRKTVGGEVDAIVLARAGLERLELDTSPLVAYEIDPERWIPAPGQGAVAVELRSTDASVRDLVARLDHGPTRACVELERRLLVHAGGGCHAPFAAWVRDAPGGVEARVGAPSRDGAWRTMLFCGTRQEVESDAHRWFDEGCPGAGPDHEGICRRVK